jgi:hypothetical protein
MHRSGTSALTRLLGLYGAALPKRLIEPNFANSAGYWEPADIVAIHDELLTAIGSTWDDLTEFPAGWVDSAAAGPFKSRLASAFEEAFGPSSLAVLKDPRICRFTPLWISILERMEIEPLFVIPVRSPLEVAASLRVREERNTTTDATRAGGTMAEAKALLLWLRHFLDAEHHTRGFARCFVSYEQLLADWRGTMAKVGRELGIEWPSSADAVTRQVESFLSREMRHHVSAGEVLATRPDVVSWVKDAYRWAQNAVAGRIGDSHELDAINEALRVASLAFHPVLAQQLEQHRVLAATLGKREASLAAEVRHAEELAAELRDLRPLIANIVDSFGQASQGLEHAVRLAGEARADLAYRLNEATARASILEEARISLSREVATAAAHAAHAANRIAGFDAECAEYRRRIETAQKQVAGLLAERDGHMRQLAELRSAAQQFEVQAQEAQTQTTQRAQEVGELAQRLLHARANLAQATVSRDTTRRTFHQQTLIIEQLRRQSQELEAQARLDRSTRMDIEERLGSLEERRVALKERLGVLEERCAALESQAAALKTALRDEQTRAEQSRMEFRGAADLLEQQKSELGLKFEELQEVRLRLEQENAILADRNELLTRLVRPVPAPLQRYVKRLLARA